jgi:hypothetical protein
MDNAHKIIIDMVEDNLLIQSSGVPHLPFHIKDEKGHVIADLLHNINSVSYARLFKNAPLMHKILWDVLENYSVSINNNSLTDNDLKILKDISELQISLLEPIPPFDIILDMQRGESDEFKNPQSKRYFEEKITRKKS